MRKIVFLLLMVLSKSAFSQIPELGHLWWSDTGYFDSSAIGTSCTSWYAPTSTCNASQTLADYLQSVGDVYLATDLDPGQGPNGEGKIKFQTGYWANYTLIGAAEQYSGSVSCTIWIDNQPWSNGNCNKTTVRADYSLVYLNQKYFDDRYTSQGGYYYYTYGLRVMLHEVGHAIGMAHNDSISTFMAESIPSNSPTTLHSLETIWINGNYL
jgi:hypothetical protein